jgi:hypothetical protein
MAEPRPEPVFPVGFDEDARAEDLDHLPASAEIALREFRKELRRHGGIPRSRLMACQAEGRDGTKLGGCVKTYIPWPDGRFGAVFMPAKHPSRPLTFACSHSAFATIRASQMQKPSTRLLTAGFIVASAPEPQGPQAGSTPLARANPHFQSHVESG